MAESDEEKPGVILDFDAAGDVVGFEILDASRRVTDPAHVEFTGVARRTARYRQSGLNLNLRAPPRLRTALPPAPR